jgi:hypothetical protein
METKESDEMLIMFVCFGNIIVFKLSLLLFILNIKDNRF